MKDVKDKKALLVEKLAKLELKAKAVADKIVSVKASLAALDKPEETK